MADPRANLKLKEETRDRLRKHKPPEQSWDEFLNGLLDGAPVVSETVELADGQVREIGERAAEEIETRLR